jgi:hypothetical protein
MSEKYQIFVDPPNPLRKVTVYTQVFESYLIAFRSPLTHASRSTTALRASCGGGDPKTALAPLKKGGNRSQSPLFKGDLGGSPRVRRIQKNFLDIILTGHNVIYSCLLSSQPLHGI